MNDRFFRIRRLLLGASVLLIGGMMYSCSDDYDLPDKKPSWLGSSIYNYLKEQGNYTNTVKLIQDLDYQEVLEKTGSKTLFVADDAAYDRFYAKNTWGVRNYDELSKAQKKLLLNSSMLDNAYLLEMMPNISSSAMNSDGKYLEKNQCLRQPTSLSATDSITYFNWNDVDVNGNSVIPTTYNLGLKNAGGKADTDYWARFRTQEKGGIRLATDATVPLMVHWIAGNMSEQKITDDDFAMIAGTTREPNDAFIFGSKVIGQDITCQNGYIDQLDEVYTTPSNMAEMIRTNGKTSYFSHMLDRFSAPYYNASLTAAYKQLNPECDSVFEKRYLSNRSQGSTLERDPKNNRVAYYLSYDPGWNTYYNPSHGLQVDMGAMFVPSDKAIEDYFLDGGGAFLMEAYAVQKPVTKENLLYNLDQIPLSTIQALINNLMKNSFIETVPSKYVTIMNDARDVMFSNCQTVEEYKAKLDTCLIANNGVVYIMNKVYSPARYASVTAPALVSDSLHIFNWAITADDKYISDPSSAPLSSFISTYLLAMSTNFDFFIPSDNALSLYYDPVSMSHTQPYCLVFKYDTKNVATPVTARAKKYDPLTGEVDSVYMTTSITSTIINNRLKDMLDQHIIVDTTAAKLGIYDGNEYFISKGGAPVRVKNPLTPSQIETGASGKMQVYGGWQLDHGQEVNVTKGYDKSEKTNGYGNGMTYVIDAPIQSTIKSVYAIMNDDENEDSPYLEFLNLCQVDPEVIEDAGFADEYRKRSEIDKCVAKYSIFTTNRPCLDQNVRFFNTYRYTVYVPDNESVKNAITNQGLPTWETIAAYIQDRKDNIAAIDTSLTIEESEKQTMIDSLTTEYKTKAQAMCTCLLNFVKYHFQDNSVFVDNNPIEATEYETSCINNETNRYITLTVASEGNHTLSVTDKTGTVRNVIVEEPQEKNYNMLARDMELNKSGNSSTTISTSSYAVVHRIKGVLNFKTFASGRYDDDWSNVSRAKKFTDKYRVRI